MTPRREPASPARPPSVAVFRAARALAGVSQNDLAGESGVSVGAIARLERYPDETPLPCKDETWTRLKTALEARGVVFLEEDEDLGEGVRLRKVP